MLVDAGAVRLEVQEAGRGDPVLLVAGYGQQLTAWDDDLLARLAAQHRVVRYDARDLGRSERVREPYLLADLARDAAGVLDALGIDRAHVLGVSMGGMVAQQLALDAPGRVRSLVSVMSTTGRRADTVTDPAAAAALFGDPPADEDGWAERAVRVRAVLGSPSYPLDEELVRRRAREDWRRGVDLAGLARQAGAIWARGQDRTEGLRGVRVPTLVVHGELDPLIGVQGGRATAAAVPGAQLWVLPGVGHELPPALNAEVAARLLAFWAAAP